MRRGAIGRAVAAQRGFAEALRHELAGTGVSVTTVFPGEARPRCTTTSAGSYPPAVACSAR